MVTVPGSLKYTCKIPNCKNKYYTNIVDTEYKNKQFISLPSDFEKRKKWCDRINEYFGSDVLDPHICKNGRICENHFRVTDFTSDLKQRLCKFAIPSVFECIDESSSNIKNESAKNEEIHAIEHTDVPSSDSDPDEIYEVKHNIDDVLGPDKIAEIKHVDVLGTDMGPEEIPTTSSQQPPKKSVLQSTNARSAEELTAKKKKLALWNENQVHTYIANELENIDGEITAIQTEISRLQEKLTKLKDRKQELQKKRTLSRSFDKRAEELYNKAGFSWSTKLQELLKSKFNIDKFRPPQLTAINATLSKKDVLLLMPTGGGKSLCYQLPAVLEDGMTLIVSPLLSLIEDQIIALDKLGILAKSINSATSKDDRKQVYDYMSKGTGPPIKLLYVTPEWLSKSKMFKSHLQKCYASGKLNRIAVDEVHCCSQWGHDFRPDYQFLSLLKDMFFDVPLIGLTATATLSVLMDVQSMLNIKDCLIFKSSFNRRNLFYEVIQKPVAYRDCVDYLVTLLQQFKGHSGIIYASTIKDTEELSEELRKKDLKVRPYHANLDAALRSKVHRKWLNNEYQAVIATVAFGMGIDKPDVRFIVHYSMPKSMEGLYQETGRAGRDGKKSRCILMYSFNDFMRSSAMISSKTEETKLRSVLEYCLKTNVCRRKLLASHFDEKWESDECRKMCDNCKTRSELVWYNITPACKYIYDIIDNAESKDVHLTLLKLFNAWFKMGEKNLRVDNVPLPLMMGTHHVELIVAHLFVKGYLTDYKSYTAYGTNCYIQKGRGRQLTPDTVIEMPVSADINIKGLKKRDSSSDEPPVKRIKVKSTD